MTTRATILCDSIKNVLAVPVYSVFREDDRFFTYVDVNASYEKQEISPGLQSDHVVEIRAGLSPGDIIALSEPPAGEIRGTVLLAPGSR